MKYDVATKITICGETHTLSEWADMYELYPSTIRCRYNTGCRDYELLEPIHKDRLDEDFVHKLWGGKWVYTGRKIIRKFYKNGLKWVYTGKNRGVDNDD
jgi:hypothetical protein